MASNNKSSNEKSKISYKKKFKAIYNLIRPKLPLSGGICVVAGQILLVLHTLPTLFIGVLGFLTGFFISGAAMITNDYFDIEVDRINHPQRPLPSGIISVNELIISAGLFTFCRFYYGPVF